jgi:branched-chain amino acid transport system ATP-binding protein
MASPLLEVEDVGKRFGGFVALDSINLTVQEGERVGLIGPNGSGKSTLVNCMCGTLTNETGIVRFNGESVNGLAAHERSRSPRTCVSRCSTPSPLGAAPTCRNTKSTRAAAN